MSHCEERNPPALTCLSVTSSPSPFGPPMCQVFERELLMKLAQRAAEELRSFNRISHSPTLLVFAGDILFFLQARCCQRGLGICQGYLLNGLVLQSCCCCAFLLSLSAVLQAEVCHEPLLRGLSDMFLKSSDAFHPQDRLL